MGKGKVKNNKLKDICIIIPFYFLFECGNLFYWSRDVDTESNGLHYIHTTFVITDGLGSKNRVGVYDHLVITP